MNYFAEEVNRLNKKIHSKAYLLRQVMAAKQFMDKHYAESISIDDLAREASLSKFHFQRLFKEKYGLTPIRYLQFLRIDQAKKLLRKGYPVTVVCGEVGFDSVPTFSKLFKTITGKMPSAYLVKKAGSDK
jgi:transcriptional regulator GlxA family with amidase domain